jgi:hypothetical protein
MAHIPFTVSAMSGSMMWLTLVAQQGGYGRIGAEYDRTARTTVASGGLAFGSALGPFKRSNPRTAVTGAEVDSNPVYEHDRRELIGPLLVYDGDESTVVADAVLDGSGRGGKQSVVPTPGDVDPGVYPGASLANQDGAGVDELAVEHLRAEALGLRIATVLGGTACLGL